MTAYLGIDPGQTGGVALVNATGELLHAGAIPVIDKQISGILLADMLAELRKAVQDRMVVVVETVHAMPKQGVSSTFTFGKGYGMVLGVVQGMALPMTQMTPQQWKKTFGLINRDKDASRQIATEMWPAMRDQWRFKYQNGVSDAALIAEAARRASL